MWERLERGDAALGCRAAGCARGATRRCLSAFVQLMSTSVRLVLEYEVGDYVLVARVQKLGSASKLVTT